MPGSDDQYDQVHTFSQDHAGKSKTTKPAVRELGRDGAPVQLFVGEERDETAVRTPPSGVVYWFFNTNGNPRVIDSSGTIASPVDGQAISPQSITNGDAKIQTAWDGLVVPVAPGLGMADAIDPANTTTPIQDAIDVLETVGDTGAILLPPETVQDASPGLSQTGYKEIIGWGAHPDASVIEMTDTSNPGILANSRDQLHRSYWDGFVFSGFDEASRTGSATHAVHVDGGSAIARWNMGVVSFDEWGDAAIFFDTNHVYNFNWQQVKGDTIAGDFLRFDDGGPVCGIGGVVGNPDGKALLANQPTMQLVIQNMNIGGLFNNPNGAVDIDAGTVDHFTIHDMNLEPASGTGDVTTSAVRLSGSGYTKIGGMVYQGDGGTIDQVIELEDATPENKHIGFAEPNGVTLNNSRIHSTSADATKNWYGGPASHVSSVGLNAGKTGIYSIPDDEYIPTDLGWVQTTSNTFTFASGGTKTSLPLNITDPTPGPVEVTANPANDPGNNHGYVVDSTFWDDSRGEVRAQVTETENAGGGTARVSAYRFKTP